MTAYNAGLTLDVQLENQEHKGGLGFLSILAQVNSLAGKFIVWIISTQPHQLKSLLQHRIFTLSKKLQH